MNPVAYLDQLATLQAAAWPAAVPRSATYPHGQQPLSEYLRAWARLQPDSVALDFYGHSLSYAELDQQSDRCAALLAERLGVFVARQAGKGVVVEMNQLWPPQQGHRQRRVEHDVQGGTQALGPGLGSAQRAVGPVTSGEQALYVNAGGCCVHHANPANRVAATVSTIL